MRSGVKEFNAEIFRDNYNRIISSSNIEKGNRLEILPHERHINRDPLTRQFVFIESGKTIFKDPHCFHAGKDGKIIEKLNEFDINKFSELCRSHKKEYLINRVTEAFKMSVGMKKDISRSKDISF